METEIMNFLQQYAVFPIGMICFGAGYVIKHYISKIPNKFIPLILGVLGLILNLAFNNFAFTPQIVIEGIASGLVATGGFGGVGSLKKKESK